MGEKIIIILLFLILSCLFLITYKTIIDPTKVIFVPVIPDETLPIAPVPSFIPPNGLGRS